MQALIFTNPLSVSFIVIHRLSTASGTLGSTVLRCEKTLFPFSSMLSFFRFLAWIRSAIKCFHLFYHKTYRDAIINHRYSHWLRTINFSLIYYLLYLFERICWARIIKNLPRLIHQNTSIYIPDLYTWSTTTNKI